MKRTTAFLFILSLVAASAAAGEFDSLRAQGMGGAFTALADDTNALYLNPAGMAFARRGSLRLSLAGGLTTTKQMAMGEPAYPYVYPSWETEGDYMVDDLFLHRPVFFDPADYGFLWDDDDMDDTLPSYEEAVQAYMTFQEAYSVYETFINLSDIATSPRFLLAGKGWAVANISQVDVSFEVGDFDSYDHLNVPVDLVIERDGGLIGGIGVELIPGIAVGANARFFQRTTETIPYIVEDFLYGAPEGFVGAVTFGSDDGVSDEVGRVELGIGGLAAFGPLNYGLYLDNLFAFLDGDTVDLGAIFDTVSVGFAWTPTNEKTADQRWPLLNLAAALDLRNFADEENRQLNMGVEGGLDLFGFLTWNLRAGYRQPLPGTLGTMISSFDPRLGTYSLGFQQKFLIFDTDFVVDFPADLIFDPPTYPLADSRAGEPFARYRGEIKIVF